MSITPEMDRALKREADVKRLVEAARAVADETLADGTPVGGDGDNDQRAALKKLVAIFDAGFTLAPFAAERVRCCAWSGTDECNCTPPAPSPSVPTPEQVAEMTTVVTCGDRIALIGNTPTDAAKFVEDQMKAGSWGYTVHLIPQSLCRCIVIAERDHIAVTATLRAEVEALESKLTAARGARDMWQIAAGRHKDERDELTAKLAAGGGDGKRTTFTVQEVAEYLSLLLESARTLAAKGAERGE